jgi:hypothetical protein
VTREAGAAWSHCSERRVSREAGAGRLGQPGPAVPLVVQAGWGRLARVTGETASSACLIRGTSGAWRYLGPDGDTHSSTLDLRTRANR